MAESPRILCAPTTGNRTDPAGLRPRDRDTVGPESLALLLRFQPLALLGARVSTFTLTIATQAADAAGGVVMSTEGPGLPQAVAALLDDDALGIPVFLAGNAFEPEHSRRQLPRRYLGTRMGGCLHSAHRDAGTGGATPLSCHSQSWIRAGLGAADGVADGAPHRCLGLQRGTTN